MNMRFMFYCFVFMTASLFAQYSVMHWSFDDILGRSAIEHVSSAGDTIEGYLEIAGGVKDKRLRLDGFTACIPGIVIKSISR